MTSSLTWKPALEMSRSRDSAVSILGELGGQEVVFGELRLCEMVGLRR